jgi:hypothetical protein
VRGDPPHTLKPKLQRSSLGKTSIPLGGRKFLLRRRGKGLDKVGKGLEGHVMLRGSLSYKVDPRGSTFLLQCLTPP